MNKFLSAFSLLIVAASVAIADTPPAKPNIIIVMPDDLAYGDYGCLGNPILKTPSVDAFMKESLLFTQFHVSPTCSPCRAALMSGRHEFKNGVTHTILERERMSLATITMPQMLKTAGYTTGIFGKWHLGDEEAYRPESRGFDEVYIHGAGGIGQTFPGSCGDAPGNTNINPTLWHNGTFVKTEGYCTDLFFEQSIKWIDAKRQGDQPFFAYVSLNAAHGPHVVPDEYCANYAGKPNISDDLAKYLGMVENIDTNFGKLLAKLKHWNIEDNTLVIYIGTDNGGGISRRIFNSGLNGGKNSVTQGGTLSPTFFRWPAGGIPAGEKCDALSAHLDLYTTLAEIVGATLTPAMQEQAEGRSLVPLLKNPSAQWTDRTLVHHTGRWKKGTVAESKYSKAAIQNSRFSLVENTALYDLKADPGETKNVIDQHPEIVTQLRAAYDAWWNDIQPLMVNEDVMPVKINPFQELYFKQFGGSPSEKDLAKMSGQPQPNSSEKPSRAAQRRKAREQAKAQQ
ncbi:Arylsulfatase [Rubripirellula tenax]|uniref:Arylsulfatase n=1 Tax=Rubripirellula tenax TaxID=2528015 RepID=A0A5C6FEQ5_9BACT|nr:arylsulfatase [Rubripirellula tenax]TWU58596.1 Arylsulfatase [Rubripirellula tenax]